MISIFKYETEEEAAQITAEQTALGMLLVQVSNVKEGNFLGFSDAPIPIKKPIELELEEVKAENTTLREQVAQTNADFTAFTDFYFEQNPTQA